MAIAFFLDSARIINPFQDEIIALTLQPSTGGVFEIYVNENLLWSRREKGGFPEIKLLKQLVRDHIAPEKSLGHTDKK